DRGIVRGLLLDEELLDRVEVVVGRREAVRLHVPDCKDEVVRAPLGGPRRAVLAGFVELRHRLVLEKQLAAHGRAGLPDGGRDLRAELAFDFVRGWLRAAAYGREGD